MEKVEYMAARENNEEKIEEVLLRMSFGILCQILNVHHNIYNLTVATGISRKNHSLFQH